MAVSKSVGYEVHQRIVDRLRKEILGEKKKNRALRVLIKELIKRYSGSKS